MYFDDHDAPPNGSVIVSTEIWFDALAVLL